MIDIFYHSEEYDFARKMIKDLDFDHTIEMAEIFKDYPEDSLKELPKEDRERIESLYFTKNYLQRILDNKQKLIDSLELLTAHQINDLSRLVDTISQDEQFITMIFQSLTKKRELSNNNSGRINFIIPRRTIAFDPNFSRTELEKTLLNLQNARRNKKSINDFVYSIEDIENKNYLIKFGISFSPDDHQKSLYLIFMDEQRSYDNSVYTYFSLEQLEKMSEELSTFILKEKIRREKK